LEWEVEMVFDCSCGRMFRVPDDAPAVRRDCPTCGSILREVSTRTPAEDLRVMKEKEKALRDALRQRDRQLRQAQVQIASLKQEIDRVRAGQPAAEPVKRELQDLRDESEQKIRLLEERTAEAGRAASRIGELEREIAAAREESETERRRRESDLSQTRHVVRHLLDGMERLAQELAALRIAAPKPEESVAEPFPALTATVRVEPPTAWRPGELPSDRLDLHLVPIAKEDPVEGGPMRMPSDRIPLFEPEEIPFLPSQSAPIATPAPVAPPMPEPVAVATEAPAPPRRGFLSRLFRRRA
jgi:hypothetical protein